MLEAFTERNALPEDEFFHVFAAYVRRSISIADKAKVRLNTPMPDRFREYCRIYANRINEDADTVFKIATISGEKPSYKILSDMGALYYEVPPRNPIRFYFWRK